MKTFVEFLNEAMDQNYVWCVYDEFDNTMVNVFNTEEEAKKAAEEYTKQAEENKAVVKKEKRSTVEK